MDTCLRKLELSSLSILYLADNEDHIPATKDIKFKMLICEESRNYDAVFYIVCSK